MNQVSGKSEGGANESYCSLEVKWIHGSPDFHHPVDPPLQIHWCGPDTVIMRQSKDVSFEAPFMYLLFGSERALLIDTGATSDRSVFPIRDVVDKQIEKWLNGKGNTDYELVIAHTHGHNDHTSGDGQFSDRPRTRVVPKDVDSVRSFFGIQEWPDEIVQFDLGNRVLEVIPSPGHDAREISFYDPKTGFLMTGDTVCPGRLYVSDFAAFQKTLQRLLVFAKDRQVSHVMGSHIEMTLDPGRDYPVTTRYQPREPPLQMSLEQLESVKNAAEEVSGKPGAHVFDDFIIFNGPSYGAVIKQLLRGRVENFRHRHTKN